MSVPSAIAELESRTTRLGVVLSPDGSLAEAEGVLNPASARTREGAFVLFPRAVAQGNVSRVARVRGVFGAGDGVRFERDGFALEPAAPYEMRGLPGGFGCEDPRVTFVPALDVYLMAYTAFGPDGPRVAFAQSHDALWWERLGLADFSATGVGPQDDKDAAFFPEPVLSPRGVLSLAFYHRPMLHISAVDGQAAIPMILSLKPCDRESVRIAYVPLEPVLRDRSAITQVAESVIVMCPDAAWGRIKLGAGTPPVRIDEGWLSLYHGVDVIDHGGRAVLRYSAGIVVHDLHQPHRVLYRSPEPTLVPETEDELSGMVNNVVFPTAIDVLAQPRTFDVYYGMADSKIGRCRLELGASTLARAEDENAA
jgi:beta-1,2-mannobiose phosphorylase / 1,2-beta-oligomannan phosphorylase